MYDVIYDDIVDAKIAKLLDSPVVIDRFGEKVYKNKKLGRKVNSILTHSNYLFFADESGYSTSKKS